MRRAHRIRDEIRAMSLPEAVRGVLRGYEEHDLLTFASAIAFQVLFAIIPLALVGLGLLGAPVRAQNAYPSQPIRLLVPFTAGSGTDVLARTMAGAVHGLAYRASQRCRTERHGQGRGKQETCPTGANHSLEY